MDTGYQMEPERVGRTRSRRLPALVGTAVPSWPSSSPSHGRGQPARPPVPDPALAAASPHPTAGTSYDRPGATPVAVPGWPVPPGPLNGPTLASTQAEGALPMLEGRRGTWGVGVTGSGPRLIRDDTWSDWTSIEPEVVQGPAQDGMPRHVLIWPGSGLCTGVQATDDRPTVIAVTLPANITRPGCRGRLDGLVD